ncbi:CPBP family intramembrane metalloprotease [Irregularibacter muris]|uniref:CPBP family intramembrane metalloprotease n=1 Tax=Irregularibacter muris TaxID=1796619 RepID=A0AAE3L2I1_9FIRM|nr:CPBP family intramembrane glutamic endopeptidase [Irregularibacter muris]MCR1898589.1 CPBP family intramembrane metalloprotease [Irregularibacter muris]
MEKTYIFVTSLIACILLYLVEQVLVVDYITKTIAKLILFMVIPYVYLKFVKKSQIKASLNFRKREKFPLKSGLVLGILSFGVIIIAYLILGRYIDFYNIAQELQTKSNISPSNFILIGLYITFGNSFLEEFFFRGFIFLNLYHQNAKAFAYIYSSLLFALYHIAIFQTWFNPMLLGLALFGLITIASIFNWLDTKTNNFVNSWVVHILADSAIILVGMRMFNMI